jgi:hypothetical protein
MQLTRDDAEEYTQALGQVMSGGWRQIALGKKLGVPQALQLSVEEWVTQRLGGYVRMSVEERRRAAAELDADGFSQRAIGDVLGVDQATVHRDLRADENASPSAATTPEDAPCPDENASPLAVHFSSETAEHFTPAEIIAAVTDCVGTIDLDPCSNEGSPNVPAARHFTRVDDGLAQRWAGRVYMNPPYGREIDAWVTKLCDSHEQGDVAEALALLPARTDTQWWQRLRDYACCFIKGRLTFIGNDDPAPFPSAIFYLGDDLGKFYEHFSSFGDVWQRVERGVHFGE